MRSRDQAGSALGGLPRAAPGPPASWGGWLRGSAAREAPPGNLQPPPVRRQSGWPGQAHPSCSRGTRVPQQGQGAILSSTALTSRLMVAWLTPSSRAIRARTPNPNPYRLNSSATCCRRRARWNRRRAWYFRLPAARRTTSSQLVGALQGFPISVHLSLSWFWFYGETGLLIPTHLTSGRGRSSIPPTT